MPDIQSDPTRQLELDRRWQCYKLNRYAHRIYTWDGRRLDDPLDEFQFEANKIAANPATGQVALRQRRPWVQYGLIRTIVQTFTARLFSPRANPSVTHVVPELAQAAAAICHHTDLFEGARAARTYGGGQGSAILAFGFFAGQLAFEALDPRHVFPRWRSRITWELEQIEIRYKYEVAEIRDGKQQMVIYWYRRVIDAQADITYRPVEVRGDDKFPTSWPIDQDTSYTHGFGECPVVWCQNILCPDELDGDHDAYGVEMFEDAINELFSQAHKGTRVNCDPTAVVTAQGKFEQLVTGGDVAIKLLPGDGVDLLEQTGTGTKTAAELIAIMRKYALEIAQCVLDDPGLGDRATATEVLRAESPMRIKCDTFRAQYGRRLILPILNKVIRAFWHVMTNPPLDMDGKVKLDTNGRPIVNSLKLRNADVLAAIQTAMQSAGELDRHDFSVVWPPYGDPIPDELQKASTATQVAREAGHLTRDAAIRFLAPYFRIMNVEALVAELAATPDPLDPAVKATAGATRAATAPTPKDEPNA